MRWREALSPVAMERVAVVAPRSALRDTLVVVGEHHPEHHDVGEAGHQRGVDVGVRHRRVGPHQRSHLMGGAALGQEGGRLDAARDWERHGGRAHGREPVRQRPQGLARGPADQGDHPPLGHRPCRSLLQLRLAGDQVGAASRLALVEVRRHRGQ